MKLMIAKSVEEMNVVASQVLDCLKQRQSDKKSYDGATILLLSGELGAGKTTFAQAVARELGVKERVTSPTFVIQKEYTTAGGDYKRLIHIDAYRLESFADLELLGWNEYSLNPDTIILLEWPEKVKAKAKLEGVSIQFFHLEAGRKIEIEY